MNPAVYYHYHRAKIRYNNIPKEDKMEAPDLKRRVIKPDEVKPSGDDVEPDPAGEKKLKDILKNKTKAEATKVVSDKLSAGEINLDDAIQAVRGH